MDQMKAAVLKAAYDISVESVQKPTPGPRELLIQMKANGICGTDAAIYSGKVKVRFPLILGHEPAGQVASVGKEVTKFKQGDRVIINPVVSCGECRFCLEGRGNLCSKGVRGREMNGANAEYVTIPENAAFEIPEHVPFDEATVIEVLATVFHSHRRIRILPSHSVLILGQGASGLLHTRLAKTSGADPVVATSRSQWKLNLAKRFGADAVINTKDEDMPQKVMEYTDGEGPDIVIESIGSPDTIRQSLDLVRPGGTVLLYGICGQSVDRLNAYHFFYKEISVIGSRGLTAEDYAPTLKLVASKKIDLKPFVTQRLPLERIKDGLELLDKSPSNVLRVIIS